MGFVKKLNSQSGCVTLTKYNGEDLKEGIKYGAPVHSNNLLRIGFLDVETTGKNSFDDKIIEIGLKVISIDKKTCKVLSIDTQYSSLEDPGVPIQPEATIVNGITDEMVKGKSIDWQYVESILMECDLIVAHNAKFDRAFLDRYLEVSNKKVWGCTMDDIEWNENGFSNKGLEILSMWHGFYYDSHRGMVDVEAMIHLVTHQFESGKPYIAELIKNSFKHYYLIEVNFPFDRHKIELCKAEKFFYNNINKSWCKKLTLDGINSAKNWVAGNLQDGVFKGIVIEIPLYDRHKK